ncbi:MAG: PLP-dependent aminotransferase family protein [Proteobacteria bacterium]|nr:PLP-dependent aminotransferase family protein [Pseudomonadota bacterium]
MFFTIDRDSKTSFQNQLRQQIVAAIMSGQLKGGAKMPSTRKMAQNLDISRTIVVLVYDRLVEDNLLYVFNRSGYRVKDLTPGEMTYGRLLLSEASAEPDDRVEWEQRLSRRLIDQRNVAKPEDWRDFAYPFVYGQPDTSLFPLGHWRECSRQAMSQMDMRDWANDAFTQDDPQLIEQIRTKLLPNRGIFVEEEEILVTLGAQNALFLIAAALTKPGMRVGLEDPGYPDVRNIFDWQGAHLVPLRVDEEGVVVSKALTECSLIYTTPSHQYPTTVTLSAKRRESLLRQASEKNFLIIEDDYESETNYLPYPVRALKSLDEVGRVIHVGSLSKSMFPGLRLGYVVAPRPLIRQLRDLRRLMYRHVPSNNQRTTSLFIAQGYHLAYARQLNSIYMHRWHIMDAALHKHLPGMAKAPVFGGTSFWIKGPKGLDSASLAARALQEGIVLEPGPIYFMKPEQGRQYFRLGFSSIATEWIEGGIATLAALLKPYGK